jgi:hypothetical protein
MVVRSVAAQSTAELSPVCAIFGGLLGYFNMDLTTMAYACSETCSCNRQEVLKCVSGKDAPLTNSVLFNGLDGAAVVERIAP